MTGNARINDLEIDDFQPVNTVTNSVRQLGDDSLLVANKKTNRSTRIRGIVTDETVAAQLREMFNNESFHIVDFTNTDIDGEMLNGIFSSSNGSVDERDGPIWHEYSVTLTGPFQRFHWIVSSDEFTTDWDTIASENFTEGGADNDFNEGTEVTLDSGHTWKAAVGDWRVNGADDFLKCDVDSGFNHCILKEVGGQDYPAIANVIIQAEVQQTGDTASAAGLTFRYQDDGDVASGTGYTFLMSTGDDNLEFYQHNGAAGITVLKTWTTFPDGSSVVIDNSTYYTMKVVCNGNRFDCFIDNSDGVLTYVGTVPDEKYKAGWYGLGSQNTLGQFDDFSLKIAKSQVVSLHVGAHDTNQIRMAATSRLNDDITADGLQRTVIAPDNPVTFKQQIQELNDSSCVLWLPMDEGGGTTVYDHSGNDNNGTLTNSPRWQAEYLNGKNRKIIDFETDNTQYITISDTDELSFPNSPFTFEAFIKIESITGSDQVVISKWNSAGNQREWTFYYNSSGYLTLFLDDSTGTNAIYAQYQTAVTLDSFLHIVGTHDGSVDENQLRLYQNGNLLTTTNSENGTYTGMISGTSSVDIGRYASATGYLDGKIAFIKVYNRELTAAEVKAKYDALQLNTSTGGEVKVWDTNGHDGDWDYLEFHAKFDEATGTSVYDSSKNNNTVTEVSIAGTEWESTSYNKHAKSSLHFNPNADAIQFTGTGLWNWSSGLTTAIWIKVDDQPAGADEYIWSYYSAGIDSRWYVYIPDGTDNLTWQLGTESAVDTGVDISYGIWYFIAVVYDGTDAYLYIDGELIDTQLAPAGLSDVDATFEIGRAGNCIDGSVDDFMLFSTALSADRIAWLYENMPNMVDESNWSRVYDKHHEFTGDMIVDNGLIRMFQDYQKLSVTNTNDREPNIVGYSDGIWNTTRYSIGTYNFGFSGDMDTHGVLVIKELNKYNVIIEHEITDSDNPDFIKMEYRVTQAPFILSKVTDWYLTGNLLLSLQSKAGAIVSTVGYDQAWRFVCISMDTVTDSEIQSGTTDGSETEGLTVGFSTQTNLLALYFDQGNDDWETFDAAVGRPVANARNRTSIDFDADTPPHYWGVGLMPFDTSLLYIDGSDDSNWTNEDGTTGVPFPAIGNVVYSEDPVGAGAAGNVVTYAKAGFPSGSYRAFFLFAGEDGTEDTYADTTGGLATTTIDIATTAVAGEWQYLDFIADENDTITFRFQRDNGDNDNTWVACGGIVVIPITNSKNFPLDIRDQMLANITIDESVGDE